MVFFFWWLYNHQHPLEAWSRCNAIGCAWTAHHSKLLQWPSITQKEGEGSFTQDSKKHPWRTAQGATTGCIQWVYPHKPYRCLRTSPCWEKADPTFGWRSNHKFSPCYQRTSVRGFIPRNSVHRHAGIRSTWTHLGLREFAKLYDHNQQAATNNSWRKWWMSVGANKE